MIRSPVLLAAAFTIFAASVARAQTATPAAVRAELASSASERRFSSGSDGTSGNAVVPAFHLETFAIETMTQGPRTRGAVFGAVWGAFAGVVLGFVVGRHVNECSGEGPCFGGLGGAAVGAALGAAAGAIIGALTAEETPP